ncbi:hypothetical protein KQX54_005903 [Cotesia glomerata]|uniref:Uncharacterized protein n=1 Tax=Cotesia glomerata TaxID=32391 RepID=A0AAV7ID75_COTGL|nr:hypothetical protein KQX54_005903 [Cotesia glomerata]
MQRRRLSNVKPTLMPCVPRGNSRGLFTRDLRFAGSWDLMCKETGIVVSSRNTDSRMAHRQGLPSRKIRRYALTVNA